MARFNNRARKWIGRKVITVPATLNGYASDDLVFGASGVGQNDESFEEVMALVESIVAGATVELWVRKVSDDSEASSAMDAGDYFLFGSPTVGTATQTGALRWVLSGWPAGKIRVKSGGTGGTMAISATAL